MGGKTWSIDEEHLFWHVIVPRSPKAVDPASRALSWEACAHEMQQLMGDEARRRYTKLMLWALQ
ncbi:hypothetical protein ESCO_000662 [Escovopsis weberi]|uniref:Uncharacterized protein n=1 Tax=Escovopsis weberi TaxID=150374 RepID=A0A0M8MYT0_ESCWE|nr:hypothetical protein ESCO_000662 [Escovopsis weberi]